jgi:hypothetical protein
MFCSVAVFSMVDPPVLGMCKNLSDRLGVPISVHEYVDFDDGFCRYAGRYVYGSEMLMREETAVLSTTMSRFVPVVSLLLLVPVWFCCD